MKLTKYQFTKLKDNPDVAYVKIRTIDNQPFPPTYIADIGFGVFQFSYEYIPGREEWVGTWE